MKNNDALQFFDKMSKNDADNPYNVKLNNCNDHTHLDADFILKYCDKSSDVLDLGSGTGLIINKFYNKVHSITAVEPFDSFTKFIVKSDNITIKNQTFSEFQVQPNLFDCITIFGTMHYFNEQESIDIYTKFIPALKKGGTLIIKNQFGVIEDVTVSGYSEEQKSNYFAQYRHIDKEVRILENIGLKNIEVVDIYPPEANRWDNTHFYAIVGNK